MIIGWQHLSCTYWYGLFLPSGFLGILGSGTGENTQQVTGYKKAKKKGLKHTYILGEL